MKFDKFGDDLEQKKDIKELNQLAKADIKIGRMATYTLRAFELVVAINQELAHLQGLQAPTACLTKEQYHYVKHGLSGATLLSPWVGNPPPVNPSAGDEVVGRRAELRSNSVRERQLEEAETILQEDNPAIPLSMAEKEDLPY